MDVAEQLQLLDRRVAYLEELTAHKEAVTDEFSEVVEFPSENPEDIANLCQWKMEKWWTMYFLGATYVYIFYATSQFECLNIKNSGLASEYWIWMCLKMWYKMV